MKADHR